MLQPSHRLKLDHAVEHLYALEAAAQRWSQTDPCVVFEDCEVETRQHRVFIEVSSTPDDPLIPLRLADCVHNLRQALDHLAYRLAIAVHRCDPPPNAGDTQFPITSSRSKFDGGIAQKVGRRKAMPKGMYTVLESLQPYNGGNAGLLGLLHELDNLDKHRFPPVVAGAATGEGFSPITNAFVHQMRLGALEPETPVLIYTPHPNQQVNVTLAFAGAIAFAKTSSVAPGMFVLPVLSNIRLFILREVFPPLEAFL